MNTEGLQNASAPNVPKKVEAGNGVPSVKKTTDLTDYQVNRLVGVFELLAFGDQSAAKTAPSANN